MARGTNISYNAEIKHFTLIQTSQHILDIGIMDKNDRALSEMHAHKNIILGKHSREWASVKKEKQENV